MAKTVMVVDDASFMRMMLKDILTKLGYNVIGEASNGLEALARYAELNPDIVTLDITMPEMDGLQALIELKKIAPQSKVIMVSAMGQQGYVVQAIQAGAIDFIVKPFQPDRVANAFKKCG